MNKKIFSNFLLPRRHIVVFHKEASNKLAIFSPDVCCFNGEEGGGGKKEGRRRVGISMEGV